MTSLARLAHFLRPRLLGLLFFIGTGISSPFVQSQTLIIEFSDSHSAYDRLPDFLRSVQSLRESYRQKEPQGKVVLLVNGDYTGLSAWAQESGWMGVKALELLARDFRVLFVMGNHDAFDWSNSVDGNRLAAQQLERLHRMGIQILGANFAFDDRTRALIQPSVDIRTAADLNLRFLGLGLEQFFQKSNWSEDTRFPMIQKMLKSFPIMQDQLAQAKKDGVNAVVFFQHDGQTEVLKRVEALRIPGGLKLPVVFSAHDHLQAHNQVEKTHVVDSRSNFDFSVVELNAKNDVTLVEFFDQKRQSELAAKFVKTEKSSALSRFIRSTERYVAKLKAESRQVITETGGFEDFKHSLKEGPRPLGTALAESLRVWGESQRSRLAANKRNLPVFALYNSSSYRRDDPIFEGPLTRGDIASFYPFPGEVLMFETRFSEVQKLFVDLRQWRLNEDGKYTPQLSANLTEAEGFQLREAGQKNQTRPNRRVLLVLDSWLSRNGYQIASFQNFLKTHPPIANHPHQNVLQDYSARVLPQFSPALRSCRRVHGRFSN